MVKIEVLSETEERMKLLLKETDRSFMNALRRTLLSEVPKMAIDSVRFQLGTKEQDDEIWETTGPIPDEMIAQRLAMVPIPTKFDRFHFQNLCRDLFYYSQVYVVKKFLFLDEGFLEIYY